MPMKRIRALLLSFLLLTACAAQPEPSSSSGEIPPPPPESIAEEPEEENPYPPSVYQPGRKLTAVETVEAYIDLLYDSYINLAEVDLTSILYLEEAAVSNSAVWHDMLVMRRRLLYENGLCYVERDEFPYTIDYIKAGELDDDRLEFWKERRPNREGEIAIHFVITGKKGKAYPPFMAVNAQHTIRLMEIDGVWKISLHYFPGSVRKFVRSGRLKAPGEEEMYADLLIEFASSDSGYPEDPPDDTIVYDGEAAAEYARQYTETSNPEFYHVGDWMGNCANFTSQCISYGFGEQMAVDWYGGDGGGSSAWENVGYFWEFIAGGYPMSGQVLEGVAEARPGDMIQTSAGSYRSVGGDGEEDYNHSMLVVNADTLVLAQNSPACFVYYADIVNVNTRLVRPLTLARQR